MTDCSIRCCVVERRCPAVRRDNASMGVRSWRCLLPTAGTSIADVCGESASAAFGTFSDLHQKEYLLLALSGDSQRDVHRHSA